MKRFNKETKTFKVFTALYNGATLTSAQAKKMGVGNLAAEASRIRQSGYAVYTCLLYTSPSPRDRQKSRMPSSA